MRITLYNISHNSSIHKSNNGYILMDMDNIGTHENEVDTA